jgi:two-component system response regulator MprA
MNAQEAVTSAKKILVVDDHRMILKAMSEELESKGYRVFTATDGSEAISAVRKERPDLILMDIIFPPDVTHGGGVAWDGLVIMQWLRRMDEAKNVPIIIVSGADPTKWKDRMLAAGAAAYFHKPVDYAELLPAIRQALGEDAGGGLS